jgi:hypothetical protein
VELLGLKGPTAVTEFANHVLAASMAGTVAGEMGIPGAAALQPLLTASTLEHIALDVSGSKVLAGAGDSDGAHASAVLVDGLKQNTACTSMHLTGVHASDVAGLLSSSSTLSVLDISNNQLEAKGAALISGALKTNTCGCISAFVRFACRN